MLAFGRGIFTATVVSTFFLLLLSFYPSDIQHTINLNQHVKPAFQQPEEDVQQELDGQRIMAIYNELEIGIPIEKITLDHDHTLDIQYGLQKQATDYGLIDSYTFANRLFEQFDTLETIRYTVMLNNRPSLSATIERSSGRDWGAVSTFSSQNTIDEIQKSFSIILLDR